MAPAKLLVDVLFAVEALAAAVLGKLDLLAQLQIVATNVVHDAAALEVAGEARGLPSHLPDVFALGVLQSQLLCAKIQQYESVGPRFVLLL